MKKNYTNVFPNDIDTRSFMSDTDLEHLDLLQQYLNLIRKKQYQEASVLLACSDSFYYGASLFHMLEDRLHRIGQYLLANGDKEALGYYQTAAPASPKKGTFWIG